MIPFFLFRTGAGPAAPVAPVKGGVRSMLAFWVGGAADPGGEAPPQPTPTGGIRHYPHRVDLSRPRPRQFGRKCWEELKAAHAAQLALERKAEKAKQEGARQALLQASHEAQEAILAVLQAEAVNAACEREVGRLTRSLQAAVGARSLTGVISSTDAVMAAAAALEREIEDEEEAIMLLLM